MATSPPFTPQSPGIYRVIATYGGDANYTGVAGTCVDANEQVIGQQQSLGSRRRSPTRPARSVSRSPIRRR